MTVLEHAKKPVGCVSWRATQLCSAYGPRQPSEDLSCRSFVQFQSGYCECENNVVVALVRTDGGVEHPDSLGCDTWDPNCLGTHAKGK